MSIAAETLSRAYKNITSSDSTATDYEVISGSTTEGKSITALWISNQDTIQHIVKLTLQCFNGSSYDNALVKSYTLQAGTAVAAPEFLVPLTYRSDGYHDKILAQIAEGVSSSKTVHVFCSGAAFTAS